MIQEFEVNVFGLMRVTRAFIPHFRENGGGTFVRVSSVGGRITFPLFSTYHATKWAVEGFSESLRYELDQFGIAVRVIEPGVIVTDFYGRSADRLDSSGLPGYADYVENVERVTMASASKAGPMEAVVRTIMDAAGGCPRRCTPRPYGASTAGKAPRSECLGLAGISYNLTRRILIILIRPILNNGTRHTCLGLTR